MNRKDHLRQALLPGIGLGAAVSLIHLDLAIAGLALFVLTLGVMVMANPKMFVSQGIEQRTLSNVDYTRSQFMAPLIVPGVTMLASFALEPAPVPPVVAAPLVFVAITASTTWSFARIHRTTALAGRRRSAAALEKAPFETATVSRIEAVSSPQGRLVVQALSEIGAVDGIQVRLWRVAQNTGLDVDELHATCRTLEQLGVTRVSGIDSGEDRSRNLVELTPVGVRTVIEARSR